MSFCKYCGKALEEGQTCDCAGAAASSAQPQNATAMQQIPAAASTASTVDASAIFNEAKDLVVSFIKNPAQAINEAYASEKKTAQYCLGAIYAIVLLIAFWISTKDLLDDSAFKTAFIITIAFCIIKLAIAGTSFLLKQGEKNFTDVLGVFCVATIAQTIAALLTFLLMAVGFDIGAIAAIVVWTIVDILHTVAAMQTVVGSSVKAERIYLTAEAVIVVIMYVILSQYIENMLSDLMWGMF